MDEELTRTERDRDAGGRAANARPRDATGKPLARDVPTDHRDVVGEPAPDLDPATAIAEAERLVLTGQPFYAHEVLEVPWHAAAADDRAFWQGLAQVAVGLTHAQRGNAVGAVSLLRSGAEKLAAYGAAFLGVAAGAVVADARRLADLIERDGTAAVSAADLRVAFRR